MPRRAAPPPPPGPGSPRMPPPPSLNRMASGATMQSLGSGSSPSVHSTPASSSTTAATAPAPAPASRQALQPRWPNAPSPDLRPGHGPDDVFQPPRAPSMVPLGGEGKGGKAYAGRNSALSIQTGHYSLYELDSSSPTPTAARARIPESASTTGSAGSGETVYAKGTYTSVPAAALRARTESNGSGSTPARSPSIGSTHSASKESLLDRGLEARSKGDLAKAAWYFRQSADAGSSTGRMYWGLALRHGWGVSKDDKKAFGELRQACDESMAQGGMDLQGRRALVGADLSAAQKRAMQEELSFGVFEIANCFLDGVGVKKSPETAVTYLRYAGNMGDIAAQEQLGFLLSKGGNGIKKDMKEAARWYRMAIDQGSTNTFGLAWVWKDKYN